MLTHLIPTSSLTARRLFPALFAGALLAVGTLAVSPHVAHAQSASIYDVECEAVDDADGDYARYTFSTDVSGLRGTEVYIGLWVRYDGSDELIAHSGDSSADDYIDPDGFVTTSDRITPRYASTNVTSEYFIPVAALPSGNYSFYPEIEIQVNGRTIEEQFEYNCLIDHTTSGDDSIPLTRGGGSDGLDYTLDPNYGGVRLRAGFTPDPHSISMTSGGSVEVADYITGSECRGFVTSAPDYNVQLSGNSRFLRFYFTSRDDTTMVINDPNGDWWCDDDTNNLNPQIAFSNPVAGTYSVWVGSFTAGEFNEGTLFVSELR